jgi:hypothetical protein
MIKLLFINSNFKNYFILFIYSLNIKPLKRLKGIIRIHFLLIIHLVNFHKLFKFILILQIIYSKLIDLNDVY